MMIVCIFQDVDKATSSRIALEKKLEQLEVEIEFLKRIHQQVDDTFVQELDTCVAFYMDNSQISLFV